MTEPQNFGKLSPFITFQDQGRFYIAQVAFPNYLGEVLRGAGMAELDSRIAWSMVEGYRVYIAFAGVLQVGGLPLEMGWRERARAAVIAMAEWYGQNRVYGNGLKWRRWLVDQASEVHGRDSANGLSDL
jgi:hypothetical protein